MEALTYLLCFLIFTGVLWGIPIAYAWRIENAYPINGWAITLIVLTTGPVSILIIWLLTRGMKRELPKSQK